MIYTVVFAVEARQDFAALYDYILPRGGERVARDYVAKIYGYCLGFETFPERGTLRDDIRPGLRLVGFRRRATIAFTVSDRTVTILRMFYAGQDIDLESDQ
ncbi:type II toxin-antitoxin system RelE/ParE family toxin [Pleomorphomonas oryzae]|uniref:type II toxin-antitoxin system RelE/ParE family toxin n=1 Tax=Pleomorphomonas oryzae TaxID=261934 RepID=UPI00041F2C2B|nr:type II toxin-antitoxin system RelE/ParE family toxin [Pleomorphomonas oryzae]